MAKSRKTVNTDTGIVKNETIDNVIDTNVVQPKITLDTASEIDDSVDSIVDDITSVEPDPIIEPVVEPDPIIEPLNNTTFDGDQDISNDNDEDEDGDEEIDLDAQFTQIVNDGMKPLSTIIEVMSLLRSGLHNKFHDDRLYKVEKLYDNIIAILSKCKDDVEDLKTL